MRNYRKGFLLKIFSEKTFKLKNNSISGFGHRLMETCNTHL